MSRIPTSSNTEIFTMRISKKLKDKLNALVKRKRFGSSASEVVRYMIEYHSRN